MDSIPHDPNSDNGLYVVHFTLTKAHAAYTVDIVATGPGALTHWTQTLEVVPGSPAAATSQAHFPYVVDTSFAVAGQETAFTLDVKDANGNPCTAEDLSDELRVQFTWQNYETSSHLSAHDISAELTAVEEKFP